MKEKVSALTAAINKLPQHAIDMQHHVNGGMYARTGFIPAGMVITGCTHKTDHISILVGDATLTLGDSVERLTGYNVLPTKKGMTRALYAHSDCWLTTIVKTDKTDLIEIENDVIETPEALQTRNPELTVNTVVLIGD